ncbi:MAG: heparinase II/III family protein [Lentisphaerales bacterium]|nr:heparinase II/III family protein [Lentisphaerales bacterium]
MKHKLFFHTLRYLKFRQIYYQLKQRFKPYVFRSFKPKTNLEVLWQLNGTFEPPVPESNNRKLFEGIFSFNNLHKKVGFPPNWDNTDMPKIWRYNLHYLDYLFFLDFEEAAKLVRSWKRSCPLGMPIAWDAYPLSLRLINCCCVFYGNYRTQTETDDSFNMELKETLYLQAQILEEQLEFHLLGNHLFENLAALMIYCNCFPSAFSDKKKAKVRNLFHRELKEQFFEDGLHYELSPMYHLRMTWLLLVLSNIKNEDLESDMKFYLSRALNALSFVTHPDGEISLLNDSALGIYTAPGSLFTWAEKFGVKKKIEHGVFSLRESGYYGWRESGNYFLCDAGIIGPSYIPAHAHADIFNFELSLLGERIVVDSGVYDYVSSEMRDYCRSTKAHNTVVIDSVNQSEVWHAFRVARRVKPRVLYYVSDSQGFVLEGEVGNYLQKNKVNHKRNFNWLKVGKLTVSDIVSGKFSKAKSYLHLHPDCKLERNEANMLIFCKGEIRFAIEFDDIEPTLEKSWYCPEFYTRLENICLVWPITARQNEISYSITII